MVEHMEHSRTFGDAQLKKPGLGLYNLVLFMENKKKILVDFVGSNNLSNQFWKCLCT